MILGLIMNMDKIQTFKFNSKKLFCLILFGLLALLFGNIHNVSAITVVCPNPGPCPASLPVTTVTAVVAPFGVPVNPVGGGGGGGGYLLSIEELEKLVELKQKVLTNADFNKDGKVDIIDLSIILFYYGERGPKIKNYDLSGDGAIGLEDISIMLYYWTLF